ncbi:MAG: type II toxin-antitoxin system Phd/YefM family antitoxin [Phycisphaerales bacterium]
MTRTTDITTFSDLRQNMRERFDRLKQTGRPLFVTSNGEPDAVLLSPEAFDSLSAKAEIAEDIAAVERGMQDVRAGRVQDFRQAIRGIADRLGLKIEG